MKQQKFVFIIFLIIAIVTILIVTTTTPTPKSCFKSRSNKTKMTPKATKAVAAKVQPEVQSEPDPLCFHDGIRYILLGYATGHKSKVTKSDMITLQSRLQVKLGNVETSIRSGKFSLGNGKYVSINCGSFWLEEVKDFIPDGEEVPENLR